MNVGELKVLSDWAHEALPTIVQGYTKIQQVLKHNSTQPAKQPITLHIDAVKEILLGMSFDQLNREQIRFLEAIGAGAYLGKNGQMFLKEIETRTDFDPATEAARAQSAVTELNAAVTRINSIRSAFQGIALPDFEESQGMLDEVLVRVEFREGALIDNVRAWKYWSNEWYDISRGITLAVGGAPEDIRVVSAGRGSILMDLAMTLLVARLFTGIISCITDSAIKITNLQLSRDNLKRQGLITDAFAKEFERKEKTLKDEAIESVIESLDKIELPKEIDGEERQALSKSVKKLINFHNRGGALDFTPPLLEDGSEDELDVGELALLAQLQEEIQSLHADQADLTRLTSEVDHDDLDTE